MQTIEVTNCAECPFYNFDAYQGDYKCGANNNLNYDGYNYINQVHEVCPLKTESITVKIKQDEK